MVCLPPCLCLQYRNTPSVLDSYDSSITVSGTFEYEFTQAGTYHYWCGTTNFPMRGLVQVEPRQDVSLPLHLKVAGVEASYKEDLGMAFIVHEDYFNI